MIEEIQSLIQRVTEIRAAGNYDPEAFRLEFLSKKGLIQQYFQAFKEVPADQKRAFGQVINTLKSEAEATWEALKQTTVVTSNQPTDDFSKPAVFPVSGSKHPIAAVRDEIIEIFSRVGFEVSEGPEIEDDWHNFSALNFPADHPARDMQDTFFVAKNPDWALRTHTSSVQVRVMESQQPPIRTISPGRVYRNEAISTRSHCMFHQVEALYIDKNVSFSDLKQTIQYFADSFFGKNTKVRMRPSYFPFTEPSAEVDI
jgi:phenylalanyl-tRNA synthetase alpha chain